MINIIKNTIIITIILCTGFIVLSVGWGRVPFDAAGGTIRGGATTIGDAAQAVHEFVSSAPDKVSTAMHWAGSAISKPLNKLGGFLGLSENQPTAQTIAPLAAKTAADKND